MGFPFAISFAILITAGQVFAYMRGMRPGLDYSASRTPRFTRRLMWGVIVRTAGYIVTALICSALLRHVDHQAWLFAIQVGLVTGLVTAVGAAVNPYIEYYAGNPGEPQQGGVWVWALVCGFVLQS